MISRNYHGKILGINKIRFLSSSSSSAASIAENLNSKDLNNIISSKNDHDDHFPRLKILPYGKIQREQKISIKSEVVSPRYKRLKANCNWTNVWPAARNFNPSTVPLPIHMSYVDDNKIRAPVSKFNNPELLKIPNFLHLTPVTVEKQCKELKKRFCTKWPTELKNDELCEKYFPLTIRTKSFLFSGPSIRWPESRIVELSFKLSRLKLDEHSLDKIKRLLDGKRYDSKTDLVTIRADSCPLRKQNYDYAHYLLTALYFESWKTEKWENEMESSDWKQFHWNQSRSKQTMMTYMQRIYPEKSINDLENDTKTKSYAESVKNLYNNQYESKQESKQLIDDYKHSVLNILFP